MRYNRRKGVQNLSLQDVLAWGKGLEGRMKSVRQRIFCIYRRGGFWAYQEDLQLLILLWDTTYINVNKYMYEQMFPKIEALIKL